MPVVLGSTMPVISGAALKTERSGVKLRRLRRQERNADDGEVDELMTRSLDRGLPRTKISGPHDEVNNNGANTLRDPWGVGDKIKRMSADILGRRGRARWRDAGRPRSMEIPADRSLSNGTSGYSTEDRSNEEVSLSVLLQFFLYHLSLSVVFLRQYIKMFWSIS